MMYAQLPLKIGLKEEARFSTFVCQNQGLKTILDNLQAMLNGQTNEIGACCFTGEIGAGKTHLLQAACRYQIEMHTDDSQTSSGVYLPLGDVTLPFIPMVLDGMEQVGLVCVDDVDLIIGQADWENALANLLLKSKNNGHAVLFASSEPVSDWKFATKALASAMMNVLPVPLEKLHQEKDLVSALQKHAEMTGFRLTTDVCNFLIKSYSKNLEELLAVLGLLEEASIVQKRRVTLPFTKQILQPKQ